MWICSLSRMGPPPPAAMLTNAAQVALDLHARAALEQHVEVLLSRLEPAVEHAGEGALCTRHVARGGARAQQPCLGSVVRIRAARVRVRVRVRAREGWG